MKIRLELDLKKMATIWVYAKSKTDEPCGE